MADRFSTIRKTRTDSKVNYGKAMTQHTEDTAEVPAEFLSHLEQAENYIFNKDTRRAKNRNYQVENTQTKQQKKIEQIKKNPKSLILLVVLLVLVIGFILFEITLELGPDEDCWEQFKNNNCNFSNPTGATCRRLLTCISGDNWQLNLLSVVGLTLSGWGAFRFRKQLRRVMIKGLVLWERFLENK